MTSFVNEKSEMRIRLVPVIIKTFYFIFINTHIDLV